MAGNFRWFPYLISQYFWIAIYAAIVLVLVRFPYSRTIKSFSPKNNEIKWDLNKDPIMFAHLTDIHINHVVPEHLDQFNSALNWTNKIQPQFIILTGDLCDDFPGRKFPKYAYQQPEDWKLYRNAISNLSIKNFIEIAGNHDEYGVFAFNSSAHNYIQGKNITQSEFLVSKEIFVENGQKIHIIKLNPFAWPSAHPPFVFFPNIDYKFLDKVEAQLENVEENDIVIMLSHYPVNLFDEMIISSSEKSLANIVRKSKFAQYFISGHLHTKTSFLQHQGENLEIVGSDLAYHNRFGMFSLDHGRFVYTDIDNTKKQPFFITSPIPMNQIAGNSIFYETNSYIRVRAFTEKSPKIRVSGDINGDMECRKANHGLGYVCSLGFNATAGKKSINFSGDYVNEMDFIVGAATEKYKEYEYETSHYKYWIFLMAFIWLLLIFVIIPLPMPKKIYEHEDWISGDEQESHWFISFFLSLLVFKYRFSKSSLWLRVIFIVLVSYPIFMPTTFIEIDGHVGFIWTYGFVCGWHFMRALWGQIHTMLYCLVVLLPGTILTASFATNNPFRVWPFIIDILVILIFIAALIFVCIRNICESAGFLRTALSPAFVIIPIFVYVIVIFERFSTKKHNYEEIHLAPAIYME